MRISNTQIVSSIISKNLNAHNNILPTILINKGYSNFALKLELRQLVEEDPG